MTVIPDGNITIKCHPHLHWNAPPHHITFKLKCHDQQSSSKTMLTKMAETWQSPTDLRDKD